jgi:mono/diheme cytochrome c family protein
MHPVTTQLQLKMKKLFSVAAVMVVLLAGCRGQASERPPIHLNPSMDFQERFRSQQANPFFEDGRSSREPVPGTVARGLLRADTGFHLGRTDDGSYVQQMPIATTREVLLRGQSRYNIFCAPCHGQAGDGQGIIMTGNYGYVPAPTFHDDRLRAEADGYFYDVTANGIRNMPGYAQQIAVADRWAIVAYIRALQRSQFALEDDVPASVRAQIEQRAAGVDTEATPTNDSPATDGTPENGADTQGDAGQTGGGTSPTN